jgi:hypothetical protein
VSDVVTYRAFGEVVRQITVTGVYDNIQNGQPGFYGVDADGEERWGYDRQIVRNDGPPS